MINQGGFSWINVLNLVGSRHEWRPLPTSIKKWFISLVAGFAFISREYISEHLPMTASETQKDIFNNHNVSDNKRCVHGSKNPHRIGLKRYLMNRSSRLLLIFLFWFGKIALKRERIVVLLTLFRMRRPKSLGRPPPHPWAAPKMPILNRVKENGGWLVPKFI